MGRRFSVGWLNLMLIGPKMGRLGLDTSTVQSHAARLVSQSLEMRDGSREGVRLKQRDHWDATHWGLGSALANPLYNQYSGAGI